MRHSTTPRSVPTLVWERDTMEEEGEQNTSQPVTKGSRMEIRRAVGIRWVQEAGAATAVRVEERQEEEGSSGTLMAKRDKGGEIARGSEEEVAGVGVIAMMEERQG